MMFTATVRRIVSLAIACAYPLTSVAADLLPSPVIVELFTSQGCSSCPAADALLARIASWSDERELPVYVLSMHVDYWNDLGWADPYSSPPFSNRQRRYAQALGSRLYTPQMVVGGNAEFVGSRGKEAKAAIDAALETPATHQVMLSAKPGGDARTIDVAYDARGKLEGQVLNLAAVQPAAANDVRRGENAGQRLSHVHVVRAFKTIPTNDRTGSVSLELPKELTTDQVEVVGYVQDAKSMAIGGAAAKQVGE